MRKTLFDPDSGLLTRFGFWQSPALLLCLASFFWALNPIVGRAARDLLSPVSIAFWRWIIALVIVAPFAWRHVRKDLPFIKQSLPFLAILGAGGLGLFAYLVYASLQWTTATNNLLLQATMPIMTLVMPAIIFRDRIPPIHYVCALISIGGIIWIITRGDPANLEIGALNRGDLLALAAVFLYSTYATFLRKAPTIHHLSLLSVLFAVGASSLAIPYIGHLLVNGISMPSLEAIGALIYVGIFPSLASYALFNRAVSLIGSARVGIYMNLPAVFGVTMAVPLLGERLENYHFVGALMVVVAILISRRTRVKAH